MKEKCLIFFHSLPASLKRNINFIVTQFVVNILIDSFTKNTKLCKNKNPVQ